MIEMTHSTLTPRTSVQRIMMRAVGMCAITLALGGCAGSKFSQVQPWEKGNLAKASMRFDGNNAIDQRARAHVYNSKENAQGGYGVGGGGCGCN
jgi:hypothetical protein